MKKILLLSLVFLLVCFGLVATASAADGHVDVDLACPTSVNYGSGSTTLNVTAYIENWSCSPVTIQRYMSGIVANAGGTLGGAGIYGPFPKWLGTSKTVPAANCTTCTNPDGCPGTIPAFTVPVTTVPNVTGKIAMAMVSFITSAGQEIGGEMCMVSVVP